MTIKNAQPFLKWAGGKRQLLDQFSELYPEDLKMGKIHKYIEPFIGGGAVFFELTANYDFDEIILNDINKELILTYKVIKKNIDELIKQLKALEDLYFSYDDQNATKEYYYEVRKKFNISKDKTNFSSINTDTIKHSAYFIFLNKTCFNGLYRENKKGYFNVPFGKYKNPKICDGINLKNVSVVLQKVKLVSYDFEKLYKFIDNETFVYFDPPYRPLTDTSSFENYSKGGFGDEGQIRLANFYKKLNNNYENVKLMLSNSNPKNSDPNDDFFVELYKHDNINLNEVIASRVINSNASKRGKISELLITNYNE